MTADESFMRIALDLAQKGFGRVNPNPAVGAVIVKDGEIIGSGYHERFGAPHAERNAIENCRVSQKGATLYVTLEPCCHFGKTPPCTDAILESGITRVVIGSSDPNPLVAGKGASILRQHGISVEQGVLKKECDEINQSFFSYITTDFPFVVMKYAMTLDGKIATCTGKSKWITGKAARNHVHHSRGRYSAIMAGIQTILTDDPLLTCRIENGKNPLRILCDSRLRLPLTSKIAATAKEVPTCVATVSEDEEKKKRLASLGITVLTVPAKDGRVDLTRLMAELGRQKVDSILLEGGGELNFSALQAKIVHKVQVYIAPKLLGGRNTKTPVEGSGVTELEQAFLGKNRKVTFLGEDILVEYDLK